MASVSALQSAYPALGRAFLAEVSAVAGRLSVDPFHLLAVIDFETAGTFDPSISNPNSSAVGLIQFVESTAQDLGTSTAELARMGRVEQMAYVERYLQPYAGRMRTVGDIYMAVLYPRAVGRAGSYVLFEQGDGAYGANRGLDENGDGLVTKREAAARVRQRLRGGQGGAGGGSPTLAGGGTNPLLLAAAVGLAATFLTTLFSTPTPS